MTTYPKRLIEADLPIKRISEHARREKSIRHGHISTLHIWWARRPLAACRAVICAALWPDPTQNERVMKQEIIGTITFAMRMGSNLIFEALGFIVVTMRYGSAFAGRMIQSSQKLKYNCQDSELYQDVSGYIIQIKLLIMGKNSQFHLNDEVKLVLYLIGAVDNSPLKSRIKIQKLMFFVSNVFKDFQGLLHFEPHLFGPYSETLDNVLESLIRLGYVQSIGSNFQLTNTKLNAYSSHKPKPELARVIDDFKRFLNDLYGGEVLAFVYASYPKYISGSVKWDELKPRRKDFAISLFRKNKVSFGKAAEIAGLTPVEFDILLKNKDIRWREIQRINDLERYDTFVQI